MSQATAAPLPRRPSLGLAAETAGVIGAVACVLLIAGLWLGRGWLGDRADALTAASVRAVERATERSDVAITALETLASQTDGIEASARQVAGDPAATSETLQALVTRLAPIMSAYTTTRDTYVSLREGVATALDAVQRIDRFVRAVDVPDNLGTALATIDDRLTAIDSAVTGVAQTGAAATGVSEGATVLANQAAAMSDALRMAEDVGRTVQVGLADLQAQLASATATLDDLVGYTAIGLTVVLIWVTLLNLALWALGRRWRAA